MFNISHEVLIFLEFTETRDLLIFQFNLACYVAVMLPDVNTMPPRFFGRAAFYMYKRGHGRFRLPRTP